MKTRTLVILLWFFALIYWNYDIWSRLLAPQRHELTVAFLDIGQGDAAYIEAPNGNQMIIDGGPDNHVIDRLKDVMPRGDQRIDAMLATHPHNDHIAGLADILEQYEVGMIIDSGKNAPGNPVFETYKQDIHSEVAEGATYVPAEHGMRIVLDKEDGVYFDVLYANASSSSKDLNEASIIGKLAYGSTTVMFTGDAYIDSEAALINWCKACLAADILKVGHHGSKTSTSEAFLDAVHPAYAVISDGKGNTYGHPNKETLDALNEKNIKIYRTDEEGTIVFTSDGREVKLR